MKIVIICAEGSMGKSLVSSLIEKFNYINLVVRARYLNDYVTGKRNINDPIFKQRTRKCVDELSVPDVGGGLGVINRSKDEKTIKINLKKIQNNLDEFYNKKYENIDEMFFDSMNILNEGTIYKKSLKKPIGVIENSKNISKYKFNDIYNGYKKNFKKFHFVFLNRNFEGWLNSIASQVMIKDNKNIFNYRLRLSSQIKRHQKWQLLINEKKQNSLHINFDDFFEREKFNNILKKISVLINEDIPKINFESETYDCFGYLSNYGKAFKKIDDNIKFLSNRSKKIASFSYKLKNSFLLFLMDVIFQFSFLIDVFIFKQKKF